MIVIGKKVTEGKSQHLEIGKEYEVTEEVGLLIIGNGNAEEKGAKKPAAKKKSK